MQILRFSEALEYGFHTTKGSKHDTNEDACLLAPELGVFAVADGMSSPAGGGVASELAVSTLEAYFKTLGEEDTRALTSKEIMEEAFQAANHVVLQRSKHEPQYMGMGTTLVAVRMEAHLLAVGSIGDSRGYLFRDGNLVQLTRDHVRSVGDDGRRKLLSRCLGFSDSPEVDVLETSWKSGDMLFLSTDGVVDVLPDSLIEVCLSRIKKGGGSLKEAASSLTRQAGEMGARDDCSVLLVAFP